MDDHRLEAASPSSKSTKEAEAIETAIKMTWQMVDPFNPPPPGSYYRGEHEGICAALKTLRENYDRALASSSIKEDGGGGELPSVNVEGAKVILLADVLSSPPSPLGDTPEQQEQKR